jgi:hypothetical protein
MAPREIGLVDIVMPGTPQAGQLYQTDAANKLVPIDTTGAATGWQLTRSAGGLWVASAPLVGASLAMVPFIIDGGGVAITTGVKGDVEIGFAGTITAWRLFADQTGSIVIDTWKDTYANFPPTVGDTMWGTKPTLSSAVKAEATGLSIAVAAGDIIRVNVDSASTVTRVTLSFTMTKS